MKKLTNNKHSFIETKKVGSNKITKTVRRDGLKAEVRTNKNKKTSMVISRNGTVFRFSGREARLLLKILLNHYSRRTK